MKKKLMIDVKKEIKKIDKENEKYMYDVETWHQQADELLCKVLRQYGENELVEWFENHDKWYA